LRILEVIHYNRKHAYSYVYESIAQVDQLKRKRAKERKRNITHFLLHLCIYIFVLHGSWLLYLSLFLIFTFVCTYTFLQNKPYGLCWITLRGREISRKPTRGFHYFFILKRKVYLWQCKLSAFTLILFCILSINTEGHSTICFFIYIHTRAFSRFHLEHVDTKRIKDAMMRIQIWRCKS